MSLSRYVSPGCAASLAGALASCALAAFALSPACARAESTWRLEQPAPPPPPPSVSEAPAPVGLGRIGDIEFQKPNLGVLITAGNPKTIPPGVWIYNGRSWRELATVCGGSDGRIAWAGPDEFWTIANARPGQALVDGRPPPNEDNTLCRFADGRVLESFARPAFEPDSYLAMHAAACIGAEDCWFGGEALTSESTEIGAFQLHWNGTTLAETPYPAEGHAIEDMQAFDGRLYASVRLAPADLEQVPVAFPPLLHVFDPETSSVFRPDEALDPEVVYAEGEAATALGFLRLSAGSKSLWAATGQAVEKVEGEAPPPSEGQQATVLRYTAKAGGEWKQILGPRTEHTGEAEFPGQTVEAIAAEPGSGEEEAWLGLQTVQEAKETLSRPPRASVPATLARISAQGIVTAHETLPSAAEGGGAKGAAYKLVCPAAGDCWMATTAGWLFHLAPEGERTLPEEAESGFSSLITERPPDQGLPQTPPDSLPPEDSGALGEQATLPTVPIVTQSQEEVRVPVALVSQVRSRLVHRTMLELRFHLAVKARVQLVAKRKHRVVAKTTMHTFDAGERRLLLALNPKRWPTELHLVEKPLAPLPTVSTNESGSETVETSLAFPAHLLTNRSGLL